MIKKTELELYSTISQAAYTNPFGRERHRLDLRAAELLGIDASSYSHSELVEPLSHALVEKVATLPSPRFGDYPDTQAAILKGALLFHIYHLFYEELNSYIAQQSQSPEPLELDFYPELRSALLTHGFAENQIAHYIAIFFQLRRAWNFIDRELIGSSSAMDNMRIALWNSIFTHNSKIFDHHLHRSMEDFSTLILGPTGSGKNAAARALGHSTYIPFSIKTKRFAHHFHDCFCPINLSQFSAGLVESELFGHVKGAFTGAVTSQHGVFAQGSASSIIFLDEIGDLDPAIQVKLLNVLQERHFSPVGSRERVAFKGRVIAATHKDITQMRRDNSFRDDFYFRLSSQIIEVPDLATRFEQDPSELKQMTSHLLSKICAADIDELCQSCLQSLAQSPGHNYHWPGNVRELEQALRRILLCGSYTGEPRAEQSDEPDLKSLDKTAAQLLSLYCKQLYARYRSYEEVARRTELDRRTVKKYVELKG